jgi:hypothetical protein
VRRIDSGRGATDHLTHIETLKLWLSDIEWIALSSPLMCGAKCFGSRPCFKCRPALPYRVGGIQSVVFRLRPFEQLKLDESRYVLQAAIAGQPDVLEVTFVPLDEWNRFIAKTLAYLS